MKYAIYQAQQMLADALTNKRSQGISSLAVLVCETDKVAYGKGAFFFPLQPPKLIYTSTVYLTIYLR